MVRAAATRKWRAYGQSKTANVLFAVQLDRLGRDRGVRAFSVHPGAIITPLVGTSTEADLADVLVLDADGNAELPEFKSPEAGPRRRSGPRPHRSWTGSVACGSRTARSGRGPPRTGSTRSA